MPRKAKEIVVHAYSDGRAPGLKRVEDLGLEATIFPAPGTSEDIAFFISICKWCRFNSCSRDSY